jgi:hypothetical protein
MSYIPTYVYVYRLINPLSAKLILIILMNYIIIVTIKKKKQYLDQFFQSNYPSRTIWPLVLKM